MKKADEIAHPASCLNRAQDGERLFVLLARDAAAPVAIRAWVAERIRIGKNGTDDSQIVEALDCADRMERERVWIAGRASCAGCGKPLDPTNYRVADGCPCNSARGVNHGAVPRETCTCVECDPAQSGSTR